MKPSDQMFHQSNFYDHRRPSFFLKSAREYSSTDIFCSGYLKNSIAFSLDFETFGMLTKMVAKSLKYHPTKD